MGRGGVDVGILTTQPHTQRESERVIQIDI